MVKAGSNHPSTVDWALMDWRKAERSRYRLQKRIYKAASRGNVKVVHNLQRKMMRSWSARVLAVRRVTQDNKGKKTAGVDGRIALTAVERVTLVNGLEPKQRKRRKHLPVRRVWIPKSGKTEKTPLGIPMIRSYCLSLQEILGMSPGAAWQGGEHSSTLLLLYHKRRSVFQRPLFPAASNGLAQGRDEIWSERDPTRPMRRGAHRLQFAELTPLGNGRDIHIEQVCRCLGRVAPIATLACLGRAGPFRAAERDGIGVANPFDFAGGKCPPLASHGPFGIEELRGSLCQDA